MLYPANYMRDQDLEAIVPPEGLHSLSFEPINGIPTKDLFMAIRNRWEFVDNRENPTRPIDTLQRNIRAPVPMVTMSDADRQRPKLEKIVQYILLLKAIPQFISRLVPKTGPGDWIDGGHRWTYEPLEHTFTFACPYYPGVAAPASDGGEPAVPQIAVRLLYLGPHAIHEGKRKVCDFCKQPSAEGLKVCSACKNAHYSSRDCQVADWKKHKKTCKAAKK